MSLAVAVLVATVASAGSARGAPAEAGERGSPGAVPSEIADLWTEALVERYEIAGGRVVVSEKPGAPDAAVCVATSIPGDSGEPSPEAVESGLRALESRGGNSDLSSSARASAWCATFPSTEIGLGIWLAESRLRQKPPDPASPKDPPVVTSERRAVALALEGAGVSGPPAPGFVISVSGGVAASDTVALVEKAFAESARHADVGRVSLDVHQTSERLSVIEAPVPAPRARHGFVVGGTAAERAALTVATELLAGGPSSRLYRDLVVRRFLAHSVAPWVSPLAGGALFGVDFEISTRTSLDRARRFIDGAIKQLRLVGPSRGELTRVRRRLQLRALLDWENPAARAKALSIHELTQGDARAWLEELGALGTLTEEAVRKAAHDYFADARRTTVETYPPLWPEDDPKLSEYRTYTVEPGDTLSELAARFGVPAQSVARANDLDPRFRLMAGQALLIPPK